MSKDDAGQRPPTKTIEVAKAVVRAELADATADRAEDCADVALDQERGARDELVQTLKDELASVKARSQAELDKERARSKWTLRIFMFENLLILVFLGVAVGVVQDGTVEVPLLGTVRVGPGNAATVESVAPAEVIPPHPHEAGPVEPRAATEGEDTAPPE